MIVSFDLDGVITNSEKWFFGIINSLKVLSDASSILLDTIEILYYSTRSTKLNPYSFLAEGDKGYIITARKPIAREATVEWLRSHAISLPVIYVDQLDDIDWSNYKLASVTSAKRKVSQMKMYGITTHIDNNPYIVDTIRKDYPDITAILYGGERCLSSM